MRLKTSAGWFFRAINYDFCPQLNQYVYWLKQPVGLVVCGAVASGLVGVFLGSQGFVLMWAFLTLLAIGAVWPWLSLKGLSCQLHFQQSRAQEGESCKVVLELTNRWPIPVFGLMLEGNFLQAIENEDDLVAAGFRKVPAWSVSRIEWPCKPEKRGRLPSTLPSITNGFPFGLYQASKPVAVKDATIVWPASHSEVPQTELAGFQFNIDGVANDRPGNDGETIGVRDYRHGDPMKNIQWTHSARCNRLIVRERQSISQIPIKVIIDLNADQHPNSQGRKTYEDAIRMASALCRSLHARQSRIQLVCLGLPQTYNAKSSNRKGLPGLLDFLALLPELEELREAMPSSSDSQLNLTSRDEFVFFVHTDQYSGELKPGKLFHPIAIDGTTKSSSVDNSVYRVEPAGSAPVVPFPQLPNSDAGFAMPEGNRHVG